MAAELKEKYYPAAPPPGRVARSQWMGHLPFAFWIAEEARPGLIVELGADTGVSFCAFCQAIAALGLQCNAYAVDLWKDDAENGLFGINTYDDLRTYVEANYASFASLIQASSQDALTLFQDDGIDLLHMDGYRDRDTLEHDFEAWLPKLSSRGIVLIHDICARAPGYGVGEAWEKISSRFPSFSFLHGNGLGVAIIGANAPRSIQDLAAASPAGRDEIRGIFHSQGKIYEWIFARENERREENARQRADCEKLLLELGNEKERHRENVKKLGATIAALKSELARTKEEFASKTEELTEEINRQYHECHDSLYRRLTAPLRKLREKSRS